MMNSQSIYLFVSLLMAIGIATSKRELLNGDLSGDEVGGYDASFTCSEIKYFNFTWSEIEQWDEDMDDSKYLHLAQVMFLNDTSSNCGKIDDIEFVYNFIYDEFEELLNVNIIICCGMNSTFGPYYDIPNGYKANDVMINSMNDNDGTDDYVQYKPDGITIKQIIVYIIFVLLFFGGCVLLYLFWRKYLKKEKKTQIVKLKDDTSSTKPRKKRIRVSKSRKKYKNSKSKSNSPMPPSSSSAAVSTGNGTNAVTLHVNGSGDQSGNNQIALPIPISLRKIMDKNDHKLVIVIQNSNQSSSGMEPSFVNVPSASVTAYTTSSSDGEPNMPNMLTLRSSTSNHLTDNDGNDKTDNDDDDDGFVYTEDVQSDNDNQHNTDDVKCPNKTDNK